MRKLIEILLAFGAIGGLVGGAAGLFIAENVFQQIATGVGVASGMVSLGALGIMHAVDEAQSNVLRALAVLHGEQVAPPR